MKNRIIVPFYFVLVFIFFFFFAAAAPAWAVKPRPPLQLTLEQADPSGREIRLTLVAKANVDLRAVALTLELPPGLVLTQGDEKGWEGSMRKGETQRIDWVVQSRDSAPRAVVGKAMIRMDAGQAFVEKRVLTLNEEKKDPPARSPSAKRKQGGETILEFKGQ